jgi:hypothetical protein
MGEDPDDDLARHERHDQRQRKPKPPGIGVRANDVRVSSVRTAVRMTMLAHRA